MKQAIDWYVKSLMKYGVFQGRASRQEFWSFWSIHIGLFALFAVLTYILFSPLVSLIYLAGASLPAAAVTVRRLHDTNRSGWWALPMITGVGIVIPFYFAFQEGQAGANDYGFPTMVFR